MEGQQNLKTDYQDYTFLGNKKFVMINNSDGTVSFKDVTEYAIEGDDFGADDINATNQRINEMNEIGVYQGTCTDEELKQAIAESDYTSNSVLKNKAGEILDPKIPRYERMTLWTNLTPNQNMGANVTINLSSDDYDELEWLFTYSTTANNGLSVNCLKGQNVHVTTLGYSSPSTVRRTINYVSATQYSTNVAKYNDGDSSNMLIPLKVIGIKYSEE